MSAKRKNGNLSKSCGQREQGITQPSIHLLAEYCTFDEDIFRVAQFFEMENRSRIDHFVPTLTHKIHSVLERPRLFIFPL